PARLDSLAARVGPLRRRRRQSADCSVAQVRALGAPRGRGSLVLDPARAVADVRALVLHRPPLKAEVHTSRTTAATTVAPIAPVIIPSAATRFIMSWPPRGSTP